MIYIISNERLEDEVANLLKVEWMEDWRSSQEPADGQEHKNLLPQARTRTNTNQIIELLSRDGGPWKRIYSGDI
jgi:hypothetical protein